MVRPKEGALATLMLLGLVTLTGCDGDAVTILRAEEPREVGDGKMVVDLTANGTTVTAVVAWTRAR